MTSLARKNLFNDIPRFLLAQAGIIFSVSLITIQLGILQGFIRSTTKLVEDSTAVFWIASDDMINLTLTAPISKSLLAQAQKVQGVERAEPLILHSALWRDSSNRIAPVTVVGLDSRSTLLSPGTLDQGTFALLSKPYTVIAYRIDLNSLKIASIGDQAKIASIKAQLVGITEGVQSTAYDPFLFTSLPAANAYINSRLLKRTDAATMPDLNSLTDDDNITYLLIQAKSNQDLQTLKQQLARVLPNVKVMTRSEMIQQIRSYWIQRTSIVFILGLGAAVGVVVGIVIVSQILYASVNDHLREFGTLKAIGVGDWQTYSIVIEQTLWMAVLRYVPSMLMCLSLGAWTEAVKGVVILITPTTGVGVFGITLMICLTSAFIAIQKATRVDPAVIFKA